jgi:5-methylcytosine-specific restriction endonuclease McrA
MQKSCSKCHIVKPLSEFNTRKNRPNGQSQCKACQNIHKRAQYQKNRERLAIKWSAKYHGRSPEEKAEYRKRANATKREYYYSDVEKHRAECRIADKRRDPEKKRKTRQVWVEKNREALRQSKKEYAAQNRERIRAHKAAWKKRHPEKVQLGRRLHRRNKKFLRTESGITIVQWNAIVEFYNNACQICYKPAGDEELTIDHIIPTSKGGLHAWQNLQPAHKSCNSAKHAKLIAFPYPPHILYFRQKWGTYKITPIRKVS